MSHPPNPWNDRIYLAVLFLISAAVFAAIVYIPGSLLLSVVWGD